MNFLVIDPSPTMRRIIKNALMEEELNNFFEATDGIDAIEKLKVRRIDCVLTEWDIPGMSGIALAKAIRRNENLKDIPVIIITARGGKKDVIEALQAQVDGYVVKPFSKAVLKEKIKNAFETRSKNAS